MYFKFEVSFYSHTLVCNAAKKIKQQTKPIKPTNLQILTRIHVTSKIN